MRFKLLSVNVTRFYLDSNYTCQLRPGARLFFSLGLSVCRHTPLLFDNTGAHSLAFFIRLLPPMVSLSITVPFFFSGPGTNPIRFYYLKDFKVKQSEIDTKVWVKATRQRQVSDTRTDTSMYSYIDNLLARRWSGALTLVFSIEGRLWASCGTGN